MTKRLVIWIAAFALFLLGCGEINSISTPIPVIAPTWTFRPLPSPTQPASATPAYSPADTSTVPPSETHPPTLTPTLTAYPQGPGEVTVPILLYHHIGVSPQGDTAYYVSPEAFEQQMNLLYQWGYRAISVELLAKTINQGAELPPKPIVLTFDDGSETVYTTALPIMQKYGFTGTAYIIYNYLWVPGYMSTEEVQALSAAGWEIGSHGVSHIDLPKHPARQENEIVKSRQRLEAQLGMPVLSFAYPFGAYNKDSLYYVHYAGYIAAMGLGEKRLQSDKNLFYLYRQAVKGTDDLAAFASFLPWQAETMNVPALTIVP